MTVLIGLDIGTTGARAIAVDLAGAVVAQASCEYPLLSPRSGWTEQRPEDWWDATRQTLGRLGAQVGSQVAGLGLTGQMHGAVVLDASDRVIRPALLWNDQRTEAQCLEITDLVGFDRLIGIAGNPALTGFQAPKLLWLREEEPESFARIARVLLPKDYVRLHLTGEYVTDVSDASGTLLLDLHRRDWSRELLDTLALPAKWMPTVLESPDVSGRLLPEIAAELGLPTGVPVVAGAGDNAAAAIGNGIVRGGLVSSSIGTSGVIFAHTPGLSPEPGGRLHAFCHAVPGNYHLMGVTLSAGGSLRWWRDALGDSLTYDELTELAGSAPPGAEGLLFLPHLAGERTPHLDPAARGAFFGLTARHRLAHLTRALMEGVTFSLRACLEIMTGLGVTVKQIRATGGGGRSAFWRQLQADVYGMPVHRTVADEGPAYGAALLAGVGAGLFRSVEECAALVRLRPEVAEPDPVRGQLYEDYFEAYRELYPSTRDLMRRLSRLAAGPFDTGRGLAAR